MKNTLCRLLLLFLTIPLGLNAQTINAAYVKSLYKKYPTLKSDFCASCKLWVNPYFKSIADTALHYPVLTYYVYTRAHRLTQEALDLPRSGIYAGWHAVPGQPNETPVYTEANKQINKTYTDSEIQKGHCQAWILMAWSIDAALLSNTYTFNAAMEYRGQNLGTQIETEEMCRTLTGNDGAPTLTDSVKIWCGTFGRKMSYRTKKVEITVPSHYYKVIEYRAKKTGKIVRLCYWMPNDPSEERTKLPERKVSYKKLINNLGFDPQQIFR